MQNPQDWIGTLKNGDGDAEDKTKEKKKRIYALSSNFAVV